MLMAAVDASESWDWVERASWIVAIILGLLELGLTIRTLAQIRSASPAESGNSIDVQNIGKNASIKQNIQDNSVSHSFNDSYTINNYVKYPTPPNKKTGETDDPWVAIAILAAVSIFIVVGYLQSRDSILRCIGILVGAFLLATAVALIASQVSSLGDLKIRTGMLMNVLAVVGSIILIARLASRTTPFGPYQEILKRYEENGIKELWGANQSSPMLFLLWEVLAVALLLLAALLAGYTQLGFLTAIEATHSQRPTWFSNRMAPITDGQFLTRPLGPIFLVLLAWLTSSVWLFDHLPDWSGTI